MEKRVYGLGRYFRMWPRFAIKIDYVNHLIFYADPSGQPTALSIIQQIPIKLQKLTYAINLSAPGAVSTPMIYTEYGGFAGKLIPGVGEGSGRTALGPICRIKPKDYLFEGAKGKNYSPTSVAAILKKAALKVGIKKM